MMRKYLDAVATVGTYKDRQTGEEKKERLNIGTVFKDDQTGRMSMKLKALPVGSEWSGWVDFFEPQARDAPREDRPRREASQTPKQDQQAAGGSDDDIPF